MNQLKMKLQKVSLISLTAFSLAACTGTETPKDTKVIAEEKNDVKYEDTKKEKDALFLVNAAEINLEEILLGQLAKQMGTMAHVKELGQTMEDDHTKSYNELTALAKKKSITIPTMATAKAQEAYKKLSAMVGADFDSEYCDMMVNGHQAAIVLFDKASVECSDKVVRTWATNTLPVLHIHLDHAIECQKQMPKKVAK